jgi:hypothetical protein
MQGNAYGEHRRFIIRTDGRVEPVDKPIIDFAEIEKMIGCGITDSVILRRGIAQVPGPESAGHVAIALLEPFVMIVDDHGYETQTVEHGPGPDLHGQPAAFRTELRPVRALKPVNALATALYHANCRPGTTHQIVGDVYVAPDADWGVDG